MPCWKLRYFDCKVYTLMTETFSDVLSINLGTVSSGHLELEAIGLESCTVTLTCAHPCPIPTNSPHRSKPKPYHNKNMYLPFICLRQNNVYWRQSTTEQKQCEQSVNYINSAVNQNAITVPAVFTAHFSPLLQYCRESYYQYRHYCGVCNVFFTVSANLMKIASGRQMAGLPPKLHMMVSRRACIQDVLKIKVEKGHVIRALL